MKLWEFHDDFLASNLDLTSSHDEREASNLQLSDSSSFSFTSLFHHPQHQFFITNFPRHRFVSN
jgi:hypothetical protein